MQVFKNGEYQTDGTEILLLSDGEDSTAKDCIDEVKDSGSIVHFIALGPSADLAVTNMSILTGNTSSLHLRLSVVVYKCRADVQLLLSSTLQEPSQGLENRVKQTQPLFSSHSLSSWLEKTHNAANLNT